MKEGENQMEEGLTEIGELHFSCGTMTKVDAQGDADLLKGIAAVISGAPRIPFTPGQYVLRIKSQ